MGQRTAGGEDVDDEKTEKSRRNGRKMERDERGRFVKGHAFPSSGGRPKLPEELKEAFQRASPRALEVLVKIVNDDEAKDADRIRAAEVIFDRGYGKPRQAVDLDATSIPQVIFVGGDDIAD